MFEAAPLSFKRERILPDSTRLVEIAYAPQWRFPEHEHPRACISLVLNGSFLDSYQGHWREVTPGCVVPYRARSSHSGFISASGATVFQLEVDELDTSSPRVAPENLEWGAGLAPGLARELHYEFCVGPLEDDLMLASLAHELASATHPHEALPRENAPRWLNRVLERLRENIARPLTLDELANEAELHRCHFAREFRRRVGTSVGDYRRRLRLALAAAKLSQTALPIAEIALDLGYADQSHMGRQFRRFTGLTPAQYRATT